MSRIIYGTVHNSSELAVVVEALAIQGIEFRDCGSEFVGVMNFDKKLLDGSITPYPFDSREQGLTKIQISLINLFQSDHLTVTVTGLDDTKLAQTIADFKQQCTSKMIEHVDNIRLLVMLIGVNPSDDVLELFRTGVVEVANFDYHYFNNDQLFTPERWRELVAPIGFSERMDYYEDFEVDEEFDVGIV